MNDVRVRSFVAVLLPDEVRARLAAHVEALRARAPRLAWVRAENLHLTLRFLGEVDTATLAAVQEALTRVAAPRVPFTVQVAGLGGFPSPRAARVLWAGVAEGGEALCALQQAIETALVALGVPAEGRAFHPHVTVARSRDPRGARDLEGALGAPVAFGTFQVETVSLMRSELAPGGSRYSLLAEAPLGRTGHSSSVDMSGGSL